MAHFYADENFPMPVVRALRALGHDVLTALEDGRANQKIEDEAVLKRASDLQWAVLTFNRRDFARLHALDCEHCGIVLLKIEPDFAGQAQRIQTAVASLETLEAQLLRVHRQPAP